MGILTTSCLLFWVELQVQVHLAKISFDDSTYTQTLHGSARLVLKCHFRHFESIYLVLAWREWRENANALT